MRQIYRCYHDMTCSSVILQEPPSSSNELAKDIEFIRVDGAADEGPSHSEVQFL